MSYWCYKQLYWHTYRSISAAKRRLVLTDRLPYDVCNTFQHGRRTIIFYILIVVGITLQYLFLLQWNTKTTHNLVKTWHVSRLWVFLSLMTLVTEVNECQGHYFILIRKFNNRHVLMWNIKRNTDKQGFPFRLISVWYKPIMYVATKVLLSNGRCTVCN